MSARSVMKAGRQGGEMAHPAGCSSHRSRTPATAKAIFLTIAVLCLSAGTIRIFSFILHDPLLAYANTYDMIRIQACHQIWPADPRIRAGDKTLAAPLDTYTFGTPVFQWACIPGSELIFTSLGDATLRIGQLLGIIGTNFSIRIFGVVRASCIVLLAWCFLRWLISDNQTGAALVHSLIFWVVLADPANTAYMSTFYSEFSALFFAYISCLAFYRICSAKESLRAALVLGTALLLLGLSKPQHLALPLGIVVALVLANRHRLRDKKLSIATAVVAAGIAVGYQAWFSTTDKLSHIAYVNATDTFLFTVLPSTHDPHAAARILGLPDRCVDHMGKSWYDLERAASGSPSWWEQSHPCPEVRNVSRSRLLWLIAGDPKFIVRVSRAGIAQLRPWFLHYLGSVGGAKDGQATEVFFSMSDWFDKVPARMFELLFVSPVVVCMSGVIARMLGESSYANFTTSPSLLLGMMMYTVCVSSLFGDGLYEFQKHSHLWASLYLSFVLVVAAVTVREVGVRLIRAKRLGAPGLFPR